MRARCHPAVRRRLSSPEKEVIRGPLCRSRFPPDDPQQEPLIGRRGEGSQRTTATTAGKSISPHPQSRPLVSHAQIRWGAGGSDSCLFCLFCVGPPPRRASSLMQPPTASHTRGALVLPITTTGGCPGVGMMGGGRGDHPMSRERARR